jgi:hypothetical protein
MAEKFIIKELKQYHLPSDFDIDLKEFLSQFNSSFSDIYNQCQDSKNYVSYQKGFLRNQLIMVTFKIIDENKLSVLDIELS